MRSKVGAASHCRAAVVGAMLAVSTLSPAGLAQAQDACASAPTAGTAAAAPCGNNWLDRAADAAKGAYTRVSEAPTWDLYVSGYARHGRHTYSVDRIAELNEHAWGAGFGKTMRGARGNDESFFALAISDSHAQVQLMTGYAREWIWPVAGSGLEVGLGYTAMFMSRRDIFGGFPFPAALPIASLGTPRARLMAAYVPRLSSNRGNGDVLFVFGRFTFD